MGDYASAQYYYDSMEEGEQVAFENMCRWLFNEFFFEGKVLLHSDPNNPAVTEINRIKSEQLQSLKKNHWIHADCRLLHLTNLQPRVSS